MAAAKDTLPYRLGFTLERLRDGATRSAPTPTDREVPRRDGGPEAPESLLWTALGAFGLRIAGRMVRGRGAGWGDLLRAAVAGAAAMIVREALQPILEPSTPIDPEHPELEDTLLAGTGLGLLYGALADPLLPGPAPLRGAAFGLLEYAATPHGGLSHLLGPVAPHRRIPGLSRALAGKGRQAELASHVAFGITLGILYGVLSAASGSAGSESSGMVNTE